MRSCFPRNFVFHTLCYLPTVSLTVLDYLLGIRLEVLRNDYLLMLRIEPSFRVVIARFCTRISPHDLVLNTTGHVVTRRTHENGSLANSLSASVHF